jgi:hypothetical protein
MAEKQSTGIKGGKRPGAGRKKGVPNKRTAEVQAKVEASGVTPLEFMLSIMRNEPPETQDLRVALDYQAMRFEAAKAAAPYVHARLAAVELTGKDGGPVETVSRVELVSLDDDSAD